MKILLLASNPNLYSNQRIIESAQKRGHEISFVNVGGCYIKISANIINKAGRRKGYPSNPTLLRTKTLIY